jgi:putative nucleotidyltransferase with HDIG domain
LPAKRVLIIDDQASIRAATSALLNGAGYSPLLASDSAEALLRFSIANSFEVVLLDILLGDSDGLQLLERLKIILPDVPVVMISGVQDITIAISAMKKGAFDYLLKPIAPEQLLNTVRRAFEHRELDRRDTLHRQSLERLVEARTEMLRRAIADLERSYDITLEALGNALDLKDAETEGHSKRVTAYSIVLARAMGLNAAEVKIIARGAFLHDIGKMAIPDAILSKPGKLTPEEQAVMREHCVRGYTILAKIPFLEKAAEIVFSHQEHYDGSGYSRGLKGEQIPLGARIFSVADALDAITSDRPYRKAQSFADARREIERCSGSQFDPSIVSVYVTFSDHLWEDLRAEITQPKCAASHTPTENFPTSLRSPHAIAVKVGSK